MGAGLAACVLVVTLIVTGRSARSDRVVNVCSWGEYIDESLITQFEEETGIRVNYQTAESNEALYSLIKMGGADFDVIVPSDYMIARLIDEDMLAELDYSHIPNFDHIADTYKNLSYRRTSTPSPTPGVHWASSTTPPWSPSLSPAGAPCSTPSTPDRC